MKLKEIAIASGIVLAYGTVQSVFAIAHPAGGTAGDVTGTTDLASTLWNIGNLAALPLGVIGAVWGGVGGASGEGRGFNYGRAAGGFVGGGALAYSPSIVTSFLTAAGAAGASLSSPETISYFGGGFLSDPAVLFIGVLSILAHRVIRGQGDVGTLRHGGR